jgi:3-dehydroquinate synthase
VELKRDVVAEDEFDTGSRMKLNLGHTVGHAIEKISGYSVSHGKAVAIGTSIVCRSAAASGFCSRKTAVNIEKLFLQFGLPIGTEYDCDALFDAALSDKKRSGGTVNLIVPRTIGDCVIQPTPVEDLKTFIKEGL